MELQSPNNLKSNASPVGIRPKVKKVASYVLLSFVFLILAGTIFYGVQWFSASLKNLLIDGGDSLTASVVAPIDNAQAFVTPPGAINKSILPIRNWEVSDLNLGARSAIVVEVGSGNEKWLFNKDGQKRLPIASLTKLMTALVVLENYDMSQAVSVSYAAAMQQGQRQDLEAGQTFSVESLLHAMLMESSNRAAYSLSEAMGTNNFIALMNDKAAKLGLLDTHFQDATGLDETSYSTAKDIAHLTQYVFENYPLFKKIVGLKEYDLYTIDQTLYHKLLNTNLLLGEQNVIGGKTGFTDGALGCLMVLQPSPEQGQYLISVLLGSADRFGEMKNIITWTDTAYTWKP